MIWILNWEQLYLLNVIKWKDNSSWFLSLQPPGLTEAKEPTNFCFTYYRDHCRQSRALFHSNIITSIWCCTRVNNIIRIILKVLPCCFSTNKAASILLDIIHWSSTNIIWINAKTWLKPVYLHVYSSRYAYIRQLVNLVRVVKNVWIQSCCHM